MILTYNINVELPLAFRRPDARVFPAWAGPQSLSR
jgi:hypothetical protein